MIVPCVAARAAHWLSRRPHAVQAQRLRAAQPPCLRPLAVQRRQRLLIIGCGDVGRRVLGLVASHWRVRATTRSAAQVPALRAAGATPLLANLDQPATLARLAGLAQRVLYLAPPPGDGAGDPRLAAALRVLAVAPRGRRATPHAPLRIVLASTTGVYGDAGGAWLSETSPTAPATARARRRADAERQARAVGRRPGWCVSVLRVPGIYALDGLRPNPLARLERPALPRSEDVYVSRIHADDLARACLRALHRAAPQRRYLICDDDRQLLGDHLDALADACARPRPQRLPRAELAAALGPAAMGFLSESRRFCTRRMRRELGLVLRHPTVLHALAALCCTPTASGVPP